MIPKRPVNPVELVVSAIHYLSEKKSWSTQNIIKHLGKKYALDIEKLRPFVCEGIRRGLATGILIHRSGLFRLNHAIIDLLKKRLSENREKLRRLKAQIRRRRLKKSKHVSHYNCQLHKSVKQWELNKYYKRNVQKQVRKMQEELNGVRKRN